MKKLRIIFTLIAIFFSLNACAMGQDLKDKGVCFERKVTKKLWRPCLAHYNKTEQDVPNNVGKFCNLTCKKWKNCKCKEYKLNVKNFSDKDFFNFTQSNGMILIDQDLL